MRSGKWGCPWTDENFHLSKLWFDVPKQISRAFQWPEVCPIIMRLGGLTSSWNIWLSIMIQSSQISLNIKTHWTQQPGRGLTGLTQILLVENLQQSPCSDVFLSNNRLSHYQYDKAKNPLALFSDFQGASKRLEKSQPSFCPSGCPAGQQRHQAVRIVAVRDGEDPATPGGFFPGWRWIAYSPASFGQWYQVMVSFSSHFRWNRSLDGNSWSGFPETFTILNQEADH